MLIIGSFPLVIKNSATSVCLKDRVESFDRDENNLQ